MTDGLRTWISPISPGGEDLAGVEVGDAQLDALGRQAGGVEPPRLGIGRPGCTAMTGSSLAP